MQDGQPGLVFPANYKVELNPILSPNFDSTDTTSGFGMWVKCTDTRYVVMTGGIVSSIEIV